MAEQERGEGRARGRRNRSLEGLIAGVGVIAVVYVSLRLLVVARGNSDTLRALAQNLNFTAIFVASILPFVTVGLAVLVFAFLSSAAGVWQGHVIPRRADQTRKQAAQTQVVAAILTLFLLLVVGWWSMPLKYAAVSVIAGGILLVVYVLSMFLHKLAGLLKALLGLYLVLLALVGVVLMIVQVGMWLPRERLTVRGSQTDVVYVLSSDGEWTKYLDAASHKVKIVRTKYVERREPMKDEVSTWNMTASEYFAK
ncbi:hypothetical protein [Mycolicibacterium holsaticum]|uniref:hypothetical protein n=1 Tax=Mycolicibacterium holsaticum TaxID=152142 RepID=UPI001C7D6EE9|nr:hypothetical protein [Mycolicibacterium holsaticum]QZA13929.1 hypothetical protein K3U96_07330 [Mycolicibacterium holsaticum DSM 44478 = JCM 12374]UNC08611.1 hypothetical protein H5U41_19500 [Mycolicibacterium holsaticum DSM 44478 = JCM 12374]